MTDAELKLWENQIFTKVVMDKLKEQQKQFKERENSGEKVTYEYLIDKYEVDTETRERLKKLILENK
jgi:hypothetical protein